MAPALLKEEKDGPSLHNSVETGPKTTKAARWGDVEIKVSTPKFSFQVIYICLLINLNQFQSQFFACG